MRDKLLALGAAVIVGSASLFGIFAASTPVHAAIDDGRDTDRYAVVYNGTHSLEEIRSSYGKKDHTAVFHAFGIRQSDVSGDIRDGVVYQDGRVVVGGKTVANGATMAARHLGGSPISGSSTAKKVSVAKMSSAQTAFVKFDSNGKFLWAIMKPCGNPVTATPPPTPQPPVAACEKLTATKISRNVYRLDAKAGAARGATVSGYYFEIKNSAGQVIGTRNVSSKALTASIETGRLAPGTYTAAVTVKTSVGDKKGAQCVVQFTVEDENKPGVSIDKKVDGVEHKIVEVNQNFTYQILVTNTGNQDLKNVKVSDPAPEGVELISADKGTIENDVWTYTISELKVGQSLGFNIKAKVVREVPGKLVNTVCVDAPQVPGNPDDCDDATVEVPPKPEPGKIIICELATKTIITINENEFDASKHSRDQADCEETPVTPPELPQTGIGETALSVFGISSLAASAYYYIGSRRHL